MSASPFRTEQYTSEHFVESVGVVLILCTTRQVCLVKHKEQDEWLLPKGRRELGEGRQDAAQREAKEETGYSCKLMGVNLGSRVPPEGSHADRVYQHKFEREPFTVTIRHLDESSVKFIWWYVAAIEEDTPQGEGESQFEAVLVDFDKVADKLTFAPDREVVARGLQLYVDSTKPRSAWWREE